ncbi:MAG TPA: alpha/beta hydrolase [Caulobacter sp.]|nr:alpha/beta hydrolase [Caulobacter sp.]
MTDISAPPGPAFRRRRIDLKSPTGDGVMTGIEMGPQDRPVDLVFNHANGFNALTYRRLLSPVADRGFRVLAVDQRGHGRSELEADPGDGHGSWLGYRDDLIALLEALGTPPKLVAGHSMGGTAGILAAGVRPDLVRRLVLLDPVVMPEGLAQSLGPDGFRNSPLATGARRRRNLFDSREAAQAAYQGRGAFRTWPPEVLADYLADGLLEREDGSLTLACAPAWESANFAAHHHNPWEAFFASACEIRILRAEEGSTANIMERADELIATGRIRVETIPGTSHFLPMEVPDLARAALLEALEG